jgi:hypothetical protein
MGARNKLAHVAASKAKRQRKARLLYRVERSEIVGMIKAIVHKETCVRGKQKAIRSTWMAFCVTKETAN